MLSPMPIIRTVNLSLYFQTADLSRAALNQEMNWILCIADEITLKELL